MLLQQCVQSYCLPFSGVTRKIQGTETNFTSNETYNFLKVIPMFNNYQINQFNL